MTDVSSPTHASRHATGGPDALTPAAIGAAAATHATRHATGGADPITPAAIGAVATNDPRLNAPPAPGPTVNLAPQNLPYTRQGFGRVRLGTGGCTIMVIDDSTGAGAGATGFRAAWPTILADMLNRYFIPCYQTWALPHNGDASNHAVDPRVNMGTDWVEQSGVYWGNTNGAPGAITFAPSSGNVQGPPSTDSFDIVLLNGTFFASVNGGPETSFTVGMTPQRKTITCPAGANNVLSVRMTSAAGFILGMRGYLSTQHTVEILNRSICAFSTNEFTEATDPYQLGNFMSHFAPDCVLLGLGINDAGLHQTSNATFSAQMQTMVTRIKAASADVILKSPFPSQGTQGTVTEAGYQSVYAALCASNVIPWLDTFTRFVSYDAGNALGFYRDGLHLTDAGYADAASAAFGALRSV